MAVAGLERHRHESGGVRGGHLVESEPQLVDQDAVVEAEPGRGFHTLDFTDSAAATPHGGPSTAGRVRPASRQAVEADQPPGAGLVEDQVGGQARGEGAPEAVDL